MRARRRPLALVVSPIQARASCRLLNPVCRSFTKAWQNWGVLGVLRMRAQRLREQCFIEDEGGPLEVDLQELASNHLKLRG